MTTKAMENLYLAQHLAAIEGRRDVVYNPHNKPIEDLPTIFCFSNGGSPGWCCAQALSEDGYGLGQHACSNEGYIPHDLGCLEGCREDRHEGAYSKHYPDGYKMEFVPSDEMNGHEGLQFAIGKAAEVFKSKQEGGE